MIPTLFERGKDRFVVPRVNPEAAWVFENVSIAVSPVDYRIQLSDINVLDIHDLEVVDAFRILRDVLSWLPEDVIFISPIDDDYIAQIKRSDFNYESEQTNGTNEKEM